VIELLIRLITKVWYDLVPSLVGWEGYRGVGGRGSMWKAADWLAWFFSLLTAAAGFFVAAGSSVAATRTSCWAEEEGGMRGGNEPGLGGVVVVRSGALTSTARACSRSASALSSRPAPSSVDDHASHASFGAFTLMNSHLSTSPSVAKRIWSSLSASLCQPH